MRQETVGPEFLARCIDQALGREPADLVIKDTRFLNLVTGELVDGDIAVCGNRIVGTYESYHGRREIDGRGKIAVPGFIDTHVHCESTLVTPAEFDRCVLPRGTTTAVCDPHEIANVMGVAGLQYFVESADAAVMDLRVNLSSCVPSSALETSGAELLAGDLLPFLGHPKVLGLAEFMNFPGGCAGKAGGDFRGAYRWPCAAGFRAAVERLSGVQHSDLSRNDQVGGGVGEIAQGDGGADPGRVGGEGCEDALTLRHAANFRADGVLHG